MLPSPRRRAPVLALSTALLITLACSDERTPDDGSTRVLIPPTGAPDLDTPPPPATPAPAEPIDDTLQAKLAIYDAVEPPRTNVLLISLDSARRDFFSCYGYRPTHAPDEKSSPHIDRLGAEGVIMEDFVSNTSWTLPSHMSLITGQPDLVHSIDTDLYALHWSRPTIAAVLQKLGYATAGFYTGPFVHERFGFARGFDRYESAYGAAGQIEHNRRAEVQTQIDDAIRTNDIPRAAALRDRIRGIDEKLDKLSHRDRSSHVVTDKSIEAIDAAEQKGEPWFVFAHYFDPHYDYIAPDEYIERFDPDYQGTLHGREFFTNLKVRRARRNPPKLLDALHPGAPPQSTERVINDRDLEHLRALYAAEIAWTDAQIGRLIDNLRARGVLDNTLVIVTADHGEQFFEHGGVGHRNNLLEEQLQVPMVLRLPGVLPAGTRVHGLASHQDVFATILEILGMPIPEELNSASMLPLIDGRDDGSDRWALGRLFWWQQVPNGPPIARILIREVFYTGTLKLFRYRNWRTPVLDRCPEDRAEKIRQTARKSRENDLRLKWIDLAVHPGEHQDEFSEDFSDPRAAAALERFQQVYIDLKSQNRDCWLMFGGTAARLTRAIPEYHSTVKIRRAQYDISPPGM